MKSKLQKVVEKDYKKIYINMDIVKKVFQWLVFSSADPAKLSLTLKAGIPFLVLLGVSDTDTLNELFGSIGVFIALAVQAITGLMTIWGLIRKIWYTYHE